MSRPLTRWGFLVVLLFVGVFVVANPTYAQESPGIVSRLLLLIGDLALALSSALGIIVVSLLDVIIIPLMQYNGFTSSPVVSAGWAIIRDTVNLFFVIVLIVIAFGTIFGWKRITWQQQVPRLMIFALVINFSKTLCGLMIDVGQVMMLTFAGALKNIAGGNFIQLFGLNDLYSISLSSTTIENVTSPGAGGFEAFDFMAAGITALFMMTIVLSTVIMLAVVLAWRIVMLLVLVTISPLAWFAGVAQGVFDTDAYKQWWSNFKCYVAVGPIITFFLWLTLAVAGSGSIAASAGFNTALDAAGSAQSTGASILKIMETSRLLSFIIGIAMIYAGFDAATKVCQSASQGGFAITAIQKGRSGGEKAFAGGVLLGAAGVRRGTRFAGKESSRLVQGTPLDMVTQAGRARRYRDIAQNTSSPYVAGIAGRWAEDLEKKVAAETKTSGEAMSGASRDTKLDYLRAMAKNIQAGGNGPITAAGKEEAMTTFASILGDPKARGKLGDENMKTLFGAMGHDMEEALKGDPTSHHNIEDFEKARPDLAFHGDSKKIEDKIADMDDVRKLDKEAMADSTVRARLQQLSSGFADEKGNELSAYDWIARGRLGAEKQESLDAARTWEQVQGNFVGSGATGRFPDAASSLRFTEALKGRHRDFAMIDSAAMKANNGDNPLARAASEALTTQGIAGLLDEYRDADDARKVELQNAFDNIDQAINTGSSSATDPRRYQSMRKYFDAARARVEGQSGVPSDTSRAQALASSIDKELSEAQGRLASLERDRNSLLEERDQLRAQYRQPGGAAQAGPQVQALNKRLETLDKQASDLNKQVTDAEERKQRLGLS